MTRDTVPVPAALAAVLAGPPIVGAACAGLSPLWDTDVLPGETPVDRAERVANAEKVCVGCPARFRCAELVESAPRVSGVVQAGKRRGALPCTARSAS